ncbi:hypothetical protein B9Z55_027415 [Caenorhabditis nigoni]|uniref:C2H2-type domain-containing protein n=1 Tax=Caenorhabditis nigoni TaxID=1611254 RepID=A0A2G5SFF8_9PELO|nr:hypothetical protein B9Z55_027415 [Caenorhabditis nigoni]
MYSEYTNVNLEAEGVKARYPCPYCGSSYLHHSGLRSHVLKKHQITIPPEEAKKNLCEICSGTFSNKGNLNEHKEVIHGIPKAGRVPAGKKEFPCDHCQKIYFSKFGRQRHVKQVHSSAKHGTSQATITVTPLPKNSYNQKHHLEKKTETDEFDKFLAYVSVYMESLRKLTIPYLPSTSIILPTIKRPASMRGFMISDILKSE